MFLVVGDQVVQCESIMAGYKAHALFRFTLFVTINLMAAQQSVGEALHRPFVPSEETPDIVTKPSIPFPPAIAYKAPHLIESSRTYCLSGCFGPCLTTDELRSSRPSYESWPVRVHVNRDSDSAGRVDTAGES